MGREADVRWERLLHLKHHLGGYYLRDGDHASCRGTIIGRSGKYFVVDDHDGWHDCDDPRDAKTVSGPFRLLKQAKVSYLLLRANGRFD